MLFFASVLCVFVSCSNNDEEEYEYFDKTAIYGTWSKTDFDSSGQPSSKLSWSFYSNQTAKQQITLYLKGIVFMDQTLDFTYQYNNKNTVILKTSTGKILNYNVFINGRQMKLGNEEDGYFELTKN